MRIDQGVGKTVDDVKVTKISSPFMGSARLRLKYPDIFVTTFRASREVSDY